MKKIDSLNLVPFIDIVLVLLVIVLTTATFVSQSRIDVEIPEVEDTKHSQSALNKDDRVITITKGGEFYLDDKPVNFEELKLLISRMPKDSSIVINGDKESNFNSFINVMNMLQTLEYTNLFVLVDDKQG